jgi:hypothetical protein
MRIDRHEHRRGLRSLEEAASIPPPWIHPLAGAEWSHYRELVARHRAIPARSRFQRAFIAFALLQRAPLAWVEDHFNRQAVAAHDPVEPPLFLIGHWGSGTTRLHQLLALDPRFGYPEVGDTLMPWNLYGTSRYCRSYVRPILPHDRLFDAVGVGLEDPQEEEVALAAMAPISYFLSIYFPSDTEGHLQRALFPETATPSDRRAFEEAYRLFHRRISLKCGGKRILFKNPASTTRMPMLRRLFPGAKFVHLVRDPLAVFASAMNRIPYLLHGFALEDFRNLDLESLVLETYETVMSRYLADRKGIPEDELVEIRFEDLEHDPRAAVMRIYERLGLGGSESAMAVLEGHLRSEPPYQRNPRPLAPATVEVVADRWRFAFEAWGYPDPSGKMPLRPYCS